MNGKVANTVSTLITFKLPGFDLAIHDPHYFRWKKSGLLRGCCSFEVIGYVLTNFIGWYCVTSTRFLN